MMVDPDDKVTLPDVEVINDNLIIREPHGQRQIPLNALASYSELLGYEDPLETVDALIHIQDHGEPEPDPETRENVWTEPYVLLTHRESARVAEYKRAIKEGTRDDPRSPALRAALSAYNAVHEPVDGGDCAMDRCRGNARNRLGLGKPSKNAGAATRGQKKVPPGLNRAAQVASPNSRVAEVLAAHLDKVPAYRDRFLASLTPDEEDPFAPEPEPEEVDPVRDVMAKYGGSR